LRTNAAPVGVPPHAKDSGQHRSARRVTGGRFELRRAGHGSPAHRHTPQPRHPRLLSSDFWPQASSGRSPCRLPAQARRHPQRHR